MDYKELEEYINNIEDPKKDIIEILLAAQGYYGKLDKEIVTYIGNMCQMSFEEIKETIEFFPFFIGDKKRIEVCKGLNCSIRGADEIERSILEDDSERNVDIIETECRGHCSTSPNIWVDDKHYGSLTPQKLELIKKELDIK